MYTTEVVKLEATVKVFAFLTKRNGIDTPAFIDHYENKHVRLVLSLAPAPLVYKRNYVVPRAYVIDERTSAAGPSAYVRR